MPYRDPEERRRAQREWAARKRASAGRRPASPLTVPAGTAHTQRIGQHCLALLEESVAEVLADDTLGSAARARTLVQLTGALLRAAEVADLEARLAQLEARLAPPRRETG